MKKKTLITLIQLVVFVGLGVFIVLYMFRQLSAEARVQMMEAIRSTHLWMLVPVLVAGFLSHFFRALRWKLLLEPLEIRPSTANTTLAVLIGYLGNLVLPRAGEVAKCTVLARYEHARADELVGSIVAERIFDTLCLLLVILTTVLLQFDVIGDFATDQLGKLATKGPAMLIAAAVLLAIIIVLVVIYRKNKRNKVGQFIRGLGEGIRAIFHLRHRGRFLLYTLGIWAMYLLQLQIGFWSIPATAHLGLLVALVVLVFGSIGMIATQGGIGAYPFLISQILLYYKLPAGDGAAFGWVSWAAQTGIILILGLAALIILPIYNRKNHYAQTRLDQDPDIQP